MTAAELKRKATAILANCAESKSRMKRSLVMQEADVIEILRAVAGAPCGHVIDLHDVICAAEKSGADVLVIGGGDVPTT
jgi:hypothetical protein